MAPNNEKSDECLADSLADCEKLVAELKLSQPSLKNLANFGTPNEKPNVLLESLGDPHVGSFDFMLDKGLEYAVQDLDEVEFLLPADCGGQKITLKLDKCEIKSPSVPSGVKAMDWRVFPTEARQRGMSYKGRCVIGGWSLYFGLTLEGLKIRGGADSTWIIIIKITKAGQLLF